jgi:hypothetical protein
MKSYACLQGLPASLASEVDGEPLQIALSHSRGASHHEDEEACSGDTNPLEEKDAFLSCPIPFPPCKH